MAKTMATKKAARKKAPAKRKRTPRSESGATGSGAAKAAARRRPVTTVDDEGQLHAIAHAAIKRALFDAERFATGPGAPAGVFQVNIVLRLSGDVTIDERGAVATEFEHVNLDPEVFEVLTPAGPAAGASEGATA